MEADTKVRIANRNDIEGMVELQRHIYSQYKRDAPFFVWQCFENVNLSVLVVAEQNKAIVGTLGIQKIKTTNDLYGGQLSWIIIADHKRGRGLFAKMVGLALECMPDLDFIFIFANTQAVSACEKTLGMKFIGTLSQLILRNDSSDVYTKYSLEPIDTNTKFAILHCGERPMTFSRSERYRRWRYANSTVYDYFKVTLPSGEYAVIKLFKKQQCTQIIGDVVDFECNLLDIHQLRLLFTAASFQLGKMGATEVATWAVPGGVLRLVLEEMGFTDSDDGSFFGIKLFDHEDHEFYDFSAWHLVQSDASNY